MDGVVVLNIIPEVNTSLWCWIIGIFTIVIFTITSIQVFTRSDFIIFSLGIALIGLFVWLIVFNADHPEQYQVSVDKSVSFVEFQENYKIISQEGKIYTVELK